MVSLAGQERRDEMKFIKCQNHYIDIDTVNWIRICKSGISIIFSFINDDYTEVGFETETERNEWIKTNEKLILTIGGNSK